MKKTNLILSLCLALLLCLLPVFASADGDRYLEINKSNFPDDTFRQWIINNLTLSGNDTDGWYMTEAQVRSVLYLDVSMADISDLTGIEHFICLTVLDCSNNQLTDLDVSGNTALQMLYCENNQLTELDVSQNTALWGLICNNNRLTSLNLDQNTALTKVSCHNNQISTLAISHCTALEELTCQSNRLTTLDLSQNTALGDLNCSDNLLTGLVLTNNADLAALACANNQLTALDTSRNGALVILNCSSNQLTDLALAGTTKLRNLDCHGNRLIALDLSHTDLTVLDCRGNQLTGLDVQENKLLRTLDCSDNQLTTLTLSGNRKLTDLNCRGNRLANPDLTDAHALVTLDCGDNPMTVLNLSSNDWLKTLNVTGCTVLQKIILSVYADEPTITADEDASFTVVRYEEEPYIDIIDMPVSVTVYEGQEAAFSVVAESNVAFSWQWQYLKPGATKWTDVSRGGYLPTYRLTAEARHNGYSYRCKLFDEDSDLCVYTDAVTLTVNTVAKPVITTQPKAVTVNVGAKATFKVAADGAESYKWQYQKPGSSTWTNVSKNGTSASYSLTTAAKHNGYKYRCAVKNAAGTVYTKAVTLTVQVKPTIKTQPKAATVYVGKKASFTVVAIDAESYKWQYQKPGETTWTNVSKNGTAATYSLTTAAKHDGYSYRCAVKNAAGTVYSNAVKLTVSVKPVITTQPKAASVTAGKKATFKVVADGATSYQWQYQKPGSSTWTNVSKSGTSASYSLTTAAKHNGYTYRCAVKNDKGTVYSNAVTLTVK